ncbi:hypothetical protein DDB_G0290977 [Dictyostelium discoideum AX4]|uniref:Transmembrane protein n=1 Tax=Dictyostelium discoideum TaxID=44689 RepID=Q54FA6_DICDI|nr:hypothetical protein DDB_G0290977 [Dictyostelium discoideum AX4]EAL61919.1 hypothetical protein DDB_G0290977 [Dictyostelium discoideum AX4]|eukprot:XP_635431.1 hypothetical protein DDB_G0290977 [Dictyostelium discoideum AX4]
MDKERGGGELNKSPDKKDNDIQNIVIINDHSDINDHQNNNDKEPLLKKQQNLKKQIDENNYINGYNINSKRLTTTTTTTTQSNKDTMINIENSQQICNNSNNNNIDNSNNNNNINNNNNNNNLKKKNDMVRSYENNIIYKTEGPFNETIPIMIKDDETGPLNLPFTFLRGLWVIILVAIFLLLATSYFIEYRFLDLHPNNNGERAIHYTFIATRPVVLVPLIFIIPLYGLNDRKTSKYSFFIGIALVLNIIGDCIYSIQINDQLENVANSSGGGGTDGDTNSRQENQNLLLNEMMYLFSLIFYMCSRLMYTIAFLIGIGKNIKPRLFHSIPFYVYSATLILLIVFSKSISPYMSRNTFQPLPDLEPNSNNNNYNYNNNNGTVSGGGDSDSSSDLTDVDPAHFSLICIYGFIEATMVWRAISLTSSFPGTSPSKMLLWLGVLGATTFGIVDTLLVINSYYHPINAIFYLSTGGIWLGTSLIVFSIPRRPDVKDYIFKVFRLNKRGIKIISKSRAFENTLVKENSINRKSSINN